MLVLNGFVMYFAFTFLVRALRAGLHGFFGRMAALQLLGMEQPFRVVAPCPAPKKPHTPARSTEDSRFKYKIAAPLRIIEQFRQFKLDAWPTLAWDCGFDVSPETLNERASGKVVEWLRAT